MQKGTLSSSTSTLLWMISVFLRTSSIPSRMRMMGIIFRKRRIFATLGFLKMSALATNTFCLRSMARITSASIRAFVWFGA